MVKKGPLAGIIILDWTQWQMGPVSTAMLADPGAEVIHIEHYINGDPGRGLTTSEFSDLPHGKHSYFEVNNRGKKSITINKSEEHTSELQSRLHLVCRLLLEKKNQKHVLLAHIMMTLSLNNDTLDLRP